jgi:hypothetical protein
MGDTNSGNLSFKGKVQDILRKVKILLGGETGNSDLLEESIELSSPMKQSFAVQVCSNNLEILREKNIYSKVEESIYLKWRRVELGQKRQKQRIFQFLPCS